jgi:ATP-dependent exoDNAse (exonuclease V) alpha subunit
LARELEERWLGQIPFTPTDSQLRFVHVWSRFMASDKPRCTLVLRGYAGTGKTTSVGAAVRTLRDMRMKCVLLAPTGRAAKVLAKHAGIDASTIHRHIYRPRRGRDGGTAFSLATNNRKNTLFIVDEASMIGESGGMLSGSFASGSLLDDLMSFVFEGEGCRLMLIGDDAQLPPVGAVHSPALQGSELRQAFDLTLAEVSLDDVVRQELDSAILANAHDLRMRMHHASEASPIPRFELGPGLSRVMGHDLEDLLVDLHHKHGQDDMVVITRSNKRAIQFNLQIRARILDQEDDINTGDRLMVVANNYHWLAEHKELPTDLIANGDTLVVNRILKRFTRHHMPFAEAEVRLVDYPSYPAFNVHLNLSVLTAEQPNMTWPQRQALFDHVASEHAHLGAKTKIQEAVQTDPCYQALQVKFAYALTCHKSQGGQWPAVIVDQGYMTEERVDLEWLRWLYTALTRAESELYLLNFSDIFFD